MHCNVCHATTPDSTRCAQCGYDGSAPGANDAARILAARDAFKERSTAYAPATRVTARDRRLPWLGLALGLALFVFWVRTCFH